MSVDLVIANPFFPPYVGGGAEHSLEQMCQRLGALGVGIHVMAPCFDGKPRTVMHNGFSVETFASPLSLALGEEQAATPYIVSDAFTRQLQERLQARVGAQPAILVANNAQCFRAVAGAALQSRVPAVAIVRDTQPVCEPGTCLEGQPASEAEACKGILGGALCLMRSIWRKNEGTWRGIPGLFWNGVRTGVRRKAMQGALRTFRHVVTISTALRSLVQDVCGEDADIRTIHNYATDTPPTSRSDVQAYLEKHGLRAGNYYLFAGRRTYGKGVDVAVSAAEICARNCSGAKLLLLGRGRIPDMTEASQDGGYVPQALLLGLLKEAKALLIPGRWQEGLHRTMIDALRIGCPIICSEAGAPSTDGVSDGLNGYVVRCNDPDALADAMTRVWRWDGTMRAQCASVAKTRFQRQFSDEVVSRAWTALLTSIQDTGVHPSPQD